MNTLNQFYARMCLPLITLAVLIGIGRPVQAVPLTEVIAQVLEMNPRVRAQLEAVKVAQEDVNIDRANALPKVNLRVSSGEEMANTPTSRATLGRESTESSDVAGLVFTQNIFSGFKNTNTQKASRSAREASVNSATSIKENTALEIVNYYLDVLHYDTLLAIAEESAGVHESLAERIRQGNQNNVSSSTDLALAESRVFLINAKREEYLGLSAAAKKRYESFLGIAPIGLEKPEPAALYDDLDVQVMLQNVRENNPQVLASFHEYESQKYLAQASRSSLYPRVDFEISGNYRNQSARQSLIQNGGREADSFIGIRISYDLYAGGGNRAARQRSLNQQEKSRYDWLDTLQIVSSETVALLENVNGLENAYQNQQRYLAQLNAVSAAYQAQFDVNLRGALNLLDQEVELFRAKVDTATMEFDLLRLKYRLAYNNGDLFTLLSL